jgi:hypothetical protein
MNKQKTISRQVKLVKKALKTYPKWMRKIIFKESEK